MNIINLEGGSAEPPEPPSGYGSGYGLAVMPLNLTVKRVSLTRNVKPKH